MTIEDIIKESFNQGWNGSHECATDFDYEYALNNCLSEIKTKVKELNIPDVINSVCVNCGKNESKICEECFEIESRFRESY